MSKEFAMLLKVRADASQAGAEFKRFEAGANGLKNIGQGLSSALSGNFSGLTSSIGGLGSSLASVHPAGMAASAAIGAVTAVAGAAAAAIWGAATAAAEYGGKLKDISEKTGLSAEFLSSLDMAAQESGSSIEELGGQFSKFNKLVGEAAKGSKEAADKLAQFGLTPKEALNDTEGALKKVFARIVALPTAAQQTKAALDAFGKSGASIIPVLKSFNGDMDQLISKATEAGFRINGATLNAMDEFDDTLTRAKGQLSALWRQFGIQFLPMLTAGLKDISKWLGENKQTVIDWGRGIAEVLRGAWEVFKDIKKWIDENPQLWEALKFSMSAGGYMMATYLGSRGRQAAAGDQPSDTTNEPTNVDPEEEAAKIADKLKRAEAALDKISKLQIQAERSRFQRATKEIIDLYQAGVITADQFQQRMTKNLAMYHAVVIQENRASLARQLVDTELTEEEKTAIRMQAQQDASALADEAIAHLQTISDLQEKVEKEREDKKYKDLESRLRREDELRQTHAQTYSAELEAQRRADLISEETYINEVYKEQKHLLEQRLKDIQTLKNASKNSEQKKDLDVQKQVIESQIKILGFKTKIAQMDLADKTDEKKKQLKEELVALEKELAEIQAQRIDNARTDELNQLEASLATSLNRLGVLRQMMTIEEEAAKEANQRRLDQLKKEKQAALDRIKGKANEEEQKFQIEEIYKKRAEMSEEEFQRKLKEIRDKYKRQASENDWREKMKNDLADAVDSMSSFADVGNALMAGLLQVIEAVSKGVGDMVQNWVLYGETGPSVMRKVLASALATIAAEAAARAALMIGYGFMYLAFGQWANAAAAFKSAAGFAIVAATYGIAGRAVAGDAFKKETSKGSNTGTSSSSSSSSSSNPGAYSSMSDTTIDASRTNPYGVIPRESVVVIKDKSGMFSQLFATEIENNSRVRQTILKLVD